MSRGSSNVIIAVLDEGVTPDHPDLPNTRQVRLNCSNFADGNPNDPSPTNNMNHGNAAAGVIAATQNNNQGITGVCPNCRIMPVRIFDTNPSVHLTPAQIADAIDFARFNGAHIISNSWSYRSENPNLHPVIVSAIQTATTQGRGGLGCVVVFAAGNNTLSNGFVHFPANVNIPGVLTVGASDRYDRKAFYSPLGNPASPNNQLIDVVAPSHRAYPWQIAGETFEAWSIDIPNNAGYNPWPAGGINPPPVGEQLPNSGTNFLAYTGRFGGTSHSCPVVAGIAGLILSLNPNFTQQQVFDLITSTAERVGGYVYTNGRSNEMGFGRVNACVALVGVIDRIAFISGPQVPTPICVQDNFTLNNVSSTVHVTWDATPCYLFQNCSGTGTTATIRPASSSPHQDQALLHSLCNPIVIISDFQEKYKLAL